jgi:hypothetical protein
LDFDSKRGFSVRAEKMRAANEALSAFSTSVLKYNKKKVNN